MTVVVITGSTRGIGFGLAQAFLERGAAVVISGRGQPAVDQAVAQLTARCPASSVAGQACDVRQPAQIQGLWESAVQAFRRVDIWINNAGIAHPQRSFWEFSEEEVKSVVETNLLGAMYGSQIALRGLLAQGGDGALYNMEGLGSTGRRVAGMALYGTTKAALRYLNRGLAAELEGKPVIAGALLPGMVATDLLTDQYAGRPEDWQRARRIFNILADRVETVAPWMAERVLENRRNGAVIAWMTRGKLLGRFLTAPFQKRDLFHGDGHGSAG